MNGSPAIEHNREALKRIVAMLVATFADFARFATGERQSAVGSGQSGKDAADASPGTPTADCRLPTAATGRLPTAATLPRHLYFAILRLLRPAESAARRLIIAAARGLVVPAPHLPRLPEPKPASMVPVLRRLGLAVRPGDLPATTRRATPNGDKPCAPRAQAFPLLDPPRRPSLGPIPWSDHRQTSGVPRILFPGFVEPSPLPPPPSAQDRVDATRLGRRLAALSAALEDLPGQARRFARWKARRDAILAQEREAAGTQPGHSHRRRIWPLRRGKPPGGRLFRYDPNAAHPRNVREVDEILAHAHSLAVFALENPDTS